MSPRQKQIVLYLLHEKRFVTIKKLSSLHNVSKRSIQYDLENIEYYAKNEGTQVERNKRLGVKLVAFPGDEKSLTQSLEKDHNIHLTPDERKGRILISLFESLKPISSNQLAKSLSVSRRTIVADLKEVEKWLEKKDLHLVYIQNKGFKVKGPEKQFRESYVESLVGHHQSEVHPLDMTFLTEHENALISQSINEVKNEFDHDIVQTAKDGLVFHIAITIHRIRNNFKITMPPEELNKLRKEPEFLIAKKIKGIVEREFALELPGSEIGYITLHLLSAKKTALENVEERLEQKQLKRIIITFINQVSIQIGVDLNSDTTLLQGLIVHLRPAIFRMKFNLRNENPLKQEIYARYPNVLTAVEVSMKPLEKAFDVTLDENEKAYLALHIGSAVERQFDGNRFNTNVILVCGSGVGTSLLLKSRLENYYPELKVYDIFSVYEIDNDYFKRNNVDWVISTVPTPQWLIPTVQVNPFLTKEDRKQINAILDIEREKVIEQRLTSGPVLKEILRPDFVNWEVSARNWKEAVTASINILIENNIVTSKYLNATINLIQNKGPYIVIDKGIAMPHAKPSDGVQLPGISFIKLEQPVYFGHSDNDPVLYVIGLATTDAQIHLNALRQLTVLLQGWHNLEPNKIENKELFIELVKQVSQL